MAIDILKQLDERIQDFLTRLDKLKNENQQLAARLTDSQHRLDEVTAQLRKAESEHIVRENERTEIKARIEKLLARFDGLDLA